MDSMWEVGVARYLDSSNIIWKYENETFLLQDGKSITPDFFIYDNGGHLIKIIEVKGLFREQNKKKFLDFQTQYPSLEVELWDFHRLRTLKIINGSGYIESF